VSLRGVGGLRVATPLQRRRTSPQKEGTMGIHPCVSGFRFTVLSYPSCIVFTRFTLVHLLACHIGNLPSCTSREFRLCQALKLKKVKFCVAPIHHPPLVAREIHFNLVRIPFELGI
jgi:hypothetical protein